VDGGGVNPPRAASSSPASQTRRRPDGSRFRDGRASNAIARLGEELRSGRRNPLSHRLANRRPAASLQPLRRTSMITNVLPSRRSAADLEAGLRNARCARSFTPAYADTDAAGCPATSSARVIASNASSHIPATNGRAPDADAYLRFAPRAIYVVYITLPMCRPISSSIRERAGPPHLLKPIVERPVCARSSRTLLHRREASNRASSGSLRQRYSSAASVIRLRRMIVQRPRATTSIHRRCAQSLVSIMSRAFARSRFSSGQVNRLHATPPGATQPYHTPHRASGSPRPLPSSNSGTTCDI